MDNIVCEVQEVYGLVRGCLISPCSGVFCANFVLGNLANRNDEKLQDL